MRPLDIPRLRRTETSLQRIQAMGVDLTPAEIQEIIRFILSPPGLAFSLLLYFAVALALAAIGGALAARLGKPRQ